MTLSAATRTTGADDILGALDEGEAGELVDLLARRASREAEVEAVERLDGREAGDAGEHLAGPGPSRVTLGAQDRFEEIGERGLFRRPILSHRRVEIGNPRSGAIRDTGQSGAGAANRS